MSHCTHALLKVKFKNLVKLSAEFSLCYRWLKVVTHDPSVIIHRGTGVPYTVRKNIGIYKLHPSSILNFIAGIQQPR